MRDFDLMYDNFPAGLVVALATVVGLCVGSFLNVVVYRVPRGESLITPGSHCPGCDTELKNRHNVPVLSWLALRGRCAFCREPISPRYPLVELATGLLFGLLAWHFGASIQLIAYLYLAAIAIALSMIDIETKRLPNSIVLPSYAVGLALFTLGALVHHDWSPLLRALAGMAGAYALFFMIRFAYPKGMGFGDVKLAGVLGLFLGALSYAAVLVGIFGAFVLGSLYGAVLLAFGRAGRRSAIPFGPFMLTGALIALFVAQPVADWYLSLAGYR